MKSIKNPAMHRSKGFTLIEMLVVILIIGILAAYFGQNIFGQTNDAKVNVAETALATKFPSALVGYHATNGYGNKVGISDLTQRGVKPESPWGQAWSLPAQEAAQSGNSITVNYPTGDASTASTNATAIIAKLGDGSGKGNSDYPMITAIKAYGGSKDGGASGVAVTYSVN